MWEKLVADFYFNFIEDNRWKYITDGLQNTLKITFFAVLIGIVLGFLVAIIRSTYENTHKLKILNAVCTVYLTVIRGTPVVVQLMIVYFVIFVAINPGVVTTAILAFGINSGAYVAEIFRAVSAPSREASLKPGGAWASTTHRPCGISSCRRPSRMWFRRWPMSLSCS